MAKTLRSVDLGPIDRLEEKIKLLVAMLGRMRAEHARLAEEHERLTRELDAARARFADWESATAEMSMLKEERDQIRARVTEMLEELDALSL
ncbi:MAG: cell division protein ZapB [Acidobacteria bacterium]|nr:cell division protein ZapB [Acidobacteriota bacterium]